MRYETEDLLVIIGRQTVQIDALNKQQAMLIAVRCPDKEAHTGEAKDADTNQHGA